MFCDNCGKSNASGVVKCAYCGADMPKTAESTGFSDILTYKPAESTDSMTSFGYADSVNNEAKKVSEAEMKKAGKLNNKVGIIAIIISVLVLLYSVNMIKTTNENIKKSQEETKQYLLSMEEKISELEKRLNVDNETPDEEKISCENIVFSAAKILETKASLVPAESHNKEMFDPALILQGGVRKITELSNGTLGANQ